MLRLTIKEQKFQERAQEIKFEEDDEHSRFEHEQEVLLKRREKFEEQVNIETDEIAAMHAKLDARKIVRADEKKMDRLQAVAEHEADIIQQDRDEDAPVYPSCIVTPVCTVSSTNIIGSVIRFTVF